MRRRELLASLGGGALASLAGCSGVFETRQVNVRTPPLVENRPNAVYFPTHVEGMEMVGMQSSGRYKCALTYTYPHRFWLVTGTRTQKVSIKDDDSTHLMPVVWDAETGIVPPDINPQITVRKGGDQVTKLSPWPMLSQPMGFHFGDNVQLAGDGTYQVEVRIGSPSIRRTGALANSEGSQTFSFEFNFETSVLNEVMYRDIPAEKEGTEGAVKPMNMEMMPSTKVPAEETLPGQVRGTAMSGDGVFVVTTLSDATTFGGSEDDTYLAVSPRTPYNRYMLPMMSLSGSVTRDGETVYDGILRATLDPELHYHYGAVVPRIASGDELTITVDSPPQTARHEGYETAFLDMEDLTLSL